MKQAIIITVVIVVVIVVLISNPTGAGDFVQALWNGFMAFIRAATS